MNLEWGSFVVISKSTSRFKSQLISKRTARIISCITFSDECVITIHDSITFYTICTRTSSEPRECICHSAVPPDLTGRRAGCGKRTSRAEDTTQEQEGHVGRRECARVCQRRGARPRQINKSH